MADELGQDDADLIAALTSQQMDNGAPPPLPANVQAPPAPANPPADKPTAQEQASERVAPKTEAANAKSEPFEFIDVDGVPMTPEQVRGGIKRYKDLNYKHQTQVAPIAKSVDFLHQLRQAAIEDGVQLNDDQLYGILEEALSAYSNKNPTLGGQAAPSAGTQRVDQTVPIEHGNGDNLPADMEAQLAEWEANNAISLPPAMKQAIVNSGTQAQQINALTQQMALMAQNGQQVATTAEGQLQQAQAVHADAGKQAIINNMQYIQQKYGFPDEAESDFMNFVQSRGYDVWELMDRNIAETLGQDFKNNQAAPEMERLRQMAQRRQAFTGNLTPAPGGNTGGAPAAQPDADQQFIDTVADDFMKSRNMV